MSSVKLNDPLAPTYRRNYRTHLALESDPVDSACCYVTNSQCSVNRSNCTRLGHRTSGSTEASPRSTRTGVETVDDEAPLLSRCSRVSDGTTASSLVPDHPGDAPKDRNGMVRMAFFLFGLVSLLPWNFFITASEYWMFKFRDVPNAAGHGTASTTAARPQHVLQTETLLSTILNDLAKTPLQSEFFSAVSIASNVPFLIILYLAALLNEKVPTRIRNPAALITTALLFASVTVLVVVDTDLWQVWYYRLTLAQMLLVAASAAVFQGGIIGVASTFPSEYTHACIIGQSAGGVVASVLQVAVLLLNVSAIISGLIYFLLALALLIFSVFVLFRTQRSAFYLYYLKCALASTRGQIQAASVASSGVVDDGYGSTYESNFEVKVRTGLVVRKLWHYCITLVLIYVGTIGVFPGVLVHVKASGSPSALWTRLFTPVACFFVFNVGDLVGRLLASTSWAAFPARRENLLVGLTMMRLMFLPLLFACNVEPRATPSMPLPVLFNSDLAFVTLNALFAVSNGYLTSAAMVLGPRKLEYFLQEKAGVILVAMLATGMTLGSVVSLLFVRAFFHPSQK